MDVYGWMDIDVATEIFFQLYMDVRNVTRIAGVASRIINNIMHTTLMLWHVSF